MDYQTDAVQRLREITNNLNTIYQTNPEYFTDRATFDQNFQMESRSAAQQDTLLNRFYAKKQQENDQNRVNSLNDSADVWNAFREGTLTQSQLDMLKSTRPDLWSQYTAYRGEKVELDAINSSHDSTLISDDLVDSISALMQKF